MPNGSLPQAFLKQIPATVSTNALSRWYRFTSSVLFGDPLLWQVGKYLARAGRKGDVLEDLKKARWYLDRRISKLEESQQTEPVASKITAAEQLRIENDTSKTVSLIPNAHDF